MSLTCGSSDLLHEGEPEADLKLEGASLVLDVQFDGEELRATLSHAGEAMAAVQTWSSRKVTLARLRRLEAEIAAVLNRGTRWGTMDAGAMELLIQRGRLLFDESLPRAIKTRLRACARGSQLTLVLDEGLVFLPWELMHTGETFLGLGYAMGRVVRAPGRIVGSARPAPSGPWKMLVLCDPRGDLMGAYYEGITLRDELDAQPEQLLVDLRSSEVGVGDVKQLIRDYDVIHYAGHARSDAEEVEDNGWLLSDGTLSAGELMDLAGGPTFPRIVFANACTSGRLGARLEPGQGQAVYGLANAFLLSGVNHYIGTLWEVPDEPACHFALAFYEAIRGSAGLGEAIRLGRLALIERYGEATVLWGSYVLYGDPASHGPAPPARSSITQPAAISRAAPHVRMDAASAIGARVRGRVGGTLPVFTAQPSLWSRGARSAAMAVAVVGALGFLALAAAPGDTPIIWTPGPVRAEQSTERLAMPDRWSAPLAQGVERVADAPAAGAPSTARPDRLEIIVPLAGDVREVRVVPNDGVMTSGESFRIRFRLGVPGSAQIWHLDSQGRVQSLRGTSATALRVNHVGWTTLPDEVRWYFLDAHTGIEEFFLCSGAADRLEAAQITFAKLNAEMVRRRSRPEPHVLRGVGGIRADADRDMARPWSRPRLLAHMETTLETGCVSVSRITVAHQ